VDTSLTLALAAMRMPWAVLFAIGIPVLIAIAIGHITFAIFTEQDFARNAFVASVKFGFVVQVYAVVAALTLVGAWDIYQTARDTLQREAGALYMLALSVDTYSLADQAGLRETMREAIRGYATSVVSRDWPALQAGMGSTASDAAFQSLARVFLDAEPATAAQQALAQNVSSWLAQAADARIGRLSVTSRTLSVLVWFLVMIVSVAVIGFQWVFGSQNQGLHYVMGGVTVSIIGCVLLVAVKLAHPFAGEPPLLTARPFLELMQVQ
jgi:hypothetical protein